MEESRATVITSPAAGIAAAANADDVTVLRILRSFW